METIIPREFMTPLFFGGVLECRVKKAGEDRWEKAWERPVKNLITNVGLGVAATSMIGATYPSSACIGTGTAAAAVGNTALGTQVDAQTASLSTVQTTVAGDTAQYISTHTAPAGGWAITEYGLKNAAGSLFTRVVFGAVSLNEADQVQFTYKCQFQRV